MDITQKALLFDKDGTLFDFAKTWVKWIDHTIITLTHGDENLKHTVADIMGYDIHAKSLAPDSLVVASTLKEVASAIYPFIHPSICGHRSVDDIVTYLTSHARTIEQIPVTPLRPLFLDLRARGYKIAIVTNDAQGNATQNMSDANILDLIDIICGYDSGYGFKPDAAPLIATSQRLNSTVNTTWMIGDSPHDMKAAQACGMRRIGVLTGLATHDMLAAHSDTVLPDISKLPEWLDAHGP